MSLRDRVRKLIVHGLASSKDEICFRAAHDPRQGVQDLFTAIAASLYFSVIASTVIVVPETFPWTVTV
jgi:hypothetical protein